MGAGLPTGRRGSSVPRPMLHVAFALPAAPAAYQAAGTPRVASGNVERVADARAGGLGEHVR